MAALTYSDSLIKTVLRAVKTIAMVGASGNEIRPSYFAMMYLLNKGYKIIPVNPGAAGKEILGQKVYASLKDVPAPVDMVDIFREAKYAPEIVREAVAEKAASRPQIHLDAAGRGERGRGATRRGCRLYRGDGSLPQDRAWPLFRRAGLDGDQPQGHRQPQAFVVQQGRKLEPLMSAITIYGDSISGNCLKIKFVCDRLGIAYRWIETNVLKAETRTAEFLAMNPAGQVPIMKLADGRVLAQSDAIIFHLAEGSDLIPADAFDRALMLQWLFWEQYSHETVIAVRRFHKAHLKKPDSEIDPALLPKGERVLTVMNDHLASNPYFVGQKLTLADIALVAYTRWAHEGGFDLSCYPKVQAWIRRVEGDLGLDHAA